MKIYLANRNLKTLAKLAKVMCGLEGSQLMIDTFQINVKLKHSIQISEFPATLNYTLNEHPYRHPLDAASTQVS